VGIDLHLPSDAPSVRMARVLVTAALDVVGVSRSCREDIAVAVGEACGNVVAHAGDIVKYGLTMSILDGRCLVEVRDEGTGFVEHGPWTRPTANALSGRGLYLIALLMDEVVVTSRPGLGTAVWFAKRLTFAESGGG
jgi:serine/threonine-protein kinase RsbW